MNCRVCGRRGRAIGVWRTLIRRIPWVRFRCDNPACTYEYVNFDGQKAKGQPVWMMPKRDVTYAHG